ncbi:MAG: hypothetical protein K9G76_02725 [Bacteroidales bacterium]|nr:hypothetical protein [Bacteroidales bacterium]MCF8405917.1 hypothetical protein [Bacteroidales bacterium]
MNKTKTYSILLTAILLMVMKITSAQIVCADVEIISDADRADFVFDSFSKYIAGMTYHGIANINIKVDDQLPANPNCKWMLTMTVENNPSGGTAADEWETMATYGSGSAGAPKIEILDARITNTCATSPVDGVYQNFNLNGDIIEIIENTGVRIDAGSCTTNVNGPGSYLVNYDEFHFQIDFRIIPGFTSSPGMYELQVKFSLTEVP